MSICTKRIQFMLHTRKNVFSMFKILFEIQNNTEKIISRVKINENFFYNLSKPFNFNLFQFSKFLDIITYFKPTN